MTSDERIEKLLNCFGQTISDLPREYAPGLSVFKTVLGFQKGESVDIDNLDTYYKDYICHLTDVIDRMEVALETAKLTMDCQLCKTPFKDCQSDCETYAKATDWQLSGMYKEEFEEFVEGEGQKDA